MALRLHDTLSGEVREFEPVVPGRAGIYVCGPTVQAPPHVGHLRSAIAFDVLRRWLVESGYAVAFVRNVTDVDDKIIHNAAHEGISPFELAERNTRAFTAAYDALGCLPPTIEPRATGHIPEMITLMQQLIDRGNAYASGGDVYFDVRSYPDYGALSNTKPDDLQVTEKVDPDRPKRDSLDFALWKGHKPGEPFWETPWGPGRPGWHLECSAMAVKYLGQPFDIHGGGYDLVFPHHENEIAQSHCLGAPLAGYWLHNGMLNIGGEKMSKSLGNSTVVAEVLASGMAPPVLRYLLASAHYRSALDYTDAALADAQGAWSRLETFCRNGVDALGGVGAAEATAMSLGAHGADAVWERFATAMDDDLAVPRALGAVHDAVTSGNTALADARREDAAAWLAVVRRMLGVLGLDPVSQWSSSAAGDLHGTVGALVELALQARRDARERKDYAAADAIRDQLAAAGIVVEDTASGVRFRLNRQ